MAATQTWPSCTVVGIDTWEPSLEQARTNIAQSGVADRVTLRQQNVTALDDEDPSVDLVICLTRRDKPGFWIPNRDKGGWDASHPQKAYTAWNITEAIGSSTRGNAVLSTRRPPPVTEAADSRTPPEKK